MIRYYVKGFEVPREGALTHWHRSATYRRANPKTRNEIFPDAERGTPSAASVNHLSEAGLRIVVAAENAREG